MKKYNNKSNLAGLLIKSHREKLNYTKVDVSTKLQLLGINISREELYRIEKGIKILKDFELVALCIVLQIDFSTLKNELSNNTSN